MFCGECGKKNEKGAKFCEECGAKLQSDAKKEIHEFGTKNKKLIILICALVVSIFGIYKFLIGKYGPEAIAKDYFLAVMNADADSIYDYLDIKEGEFTSKKIFKKVFNVQKEDLVNYSVSSFEKASDGLTATVHISYTLKGKSSSDSANINLVRDKKNKFLIFENWKISDKFMETVNDFELTVPKDSTVVIEDVKLDKKYKTDGSKDADVYKIPEMFKGKYDVKVTLKNGLTLEDDVNVTGYKSASINNLKVSSSDQKKLEKKLPEIIEKLYQDAIQEKSFEDVKKDYEYDGSDLSKLESSYNSFMKIISAGGLKKFNVKKVKINSIRFDDGIIRVTADVDFDYTASYKILDNEKESSGNNSDIMYFDFDYSKDFKLVNISSMAKLFI
ncbi:MAG: zinc-ribbon domain-containing protein [Bacilli bacterium]|nr:zinc-ribbon domain-containing protein [Bacilli bacterium]